jgi:lipopolysaccharide transport system permease protein
MRSQAITTYSPEAEIRRPGLLLRNMLRDVRSSRELAWRLAQRDIKAQYRQSYLGYLWAFITPLITTVTWVYLNVSGVVRVSNTGIPYPVYVFCGTMLWQVLLESVQSPLQQIGLSRAMLTRLNFPREALILSGLVKIFSNIGIKLVLLIPVILLFGIRPDMGFLLLPIGLLSIVMLGFSIGLLITPLGLLYTDVVRGIPLVSQFLMYLTPVVFAMPTDGWMALVCKWNPATPLIVSSREWLTGAATSMPYEFLLVTILSAVLLLFSWIFYRVTIPVLIERM